MPFAQRGFGCRLTWGRRGVAGADVLIVVDVLSFSTAVATAVARGAEVLPCATTTDARALAERMGATAAVRRGEPGRFSLSPPTMEAARPGERIVLPSPNGATCAAAAGAASRVFAGALVNARAVAEVVRPLLAGHTVTVLACGERWAEDGALRVAVEDYLGAGAILEALGGDRSPEAEVCARAFRAVRDDVPRLLADCGSGRELAERGYAGDVVHAARIDACDCAPQLVDGAFKPSAGGGS